MSGEDLDGASRGYTPALASITRAMSMRAFVKNTFLEFEETDSRGDASACASPMASPRSVISEPVSLVASERWLCPAAAAHIMTCAGKKANGPLTSALAEKQDTMIAEQSSPRSKTISERLLCLENEHFETDFITTDSMVKHSGLPLVCGGLRADRSRRSTRSSQPDIDQCPCEEDGSDGSAYSVLSGHFGHHEVLDGVSSGEGGVSEGSDNPHLCPAASDAIVQMEATVESTVLEFRRMTPSWPKASGSADVQPTAVQSERKGCTAQSEARDEPCCPAAAVAERPAALVPRGEQGGAGSHLGGGPAEGSSLWTTLMLQNIPIDYTRSMLLEWIDASGLAARYDFFYYPMDFNKGHGLGYAFINMLTVADAEHARTALTGFREWLVPSNKVCCVGWSNPSQGLDANVDRFRNSPLMHPSMDDEFKPMVFEGGVRVPFPPPTKKVRKRKVGKVWKAAAVQR